MKAREKGNKLEEIIHSLYKGEDCSIVRNAFLKPLYSTGKRKKREIDILITRNVAGLEIKIAIECKNEKSVVGTPRIDAFIGKLQDIGIPIQHGIYVTSKGYTKGALERAKVAGISTLVLNELSPVEVQKAVNKATQSNVYVIPDIVSINFQTKCHTATLFLHDHNKKFVGLIPDLVWKSWLKDDVAPILGMHEVHIPIPDGWVQIIEDIEYEIRDLVIQVRLIGYVATIEGNTKAYHLVDATTKELQRGTIKVDFESLPEQIRLLPFFEEDELTSYFEKFDINLVFGRIKAPRIIYQRMFWPPSESALKRIVELMDSGITPDKATLSDVEGSSFETIWDNYYKDYIEWMGTGLEAYLESQKND